MLLLSSADFFSEFFFFLNMILGRLSVAKCLDPDQDRQFVGPDLGPNCLKRLSADDKCHGWEGVKHTQLYISGRARDLNCGLSLHLLLYFVYVNRVGSDDMGG